MFRCGLPWSPVSACFPVPVTRSTVLSSRWIALIEWLLVSQTNKTELESQHMPCGELNLASEKSANIKQNTLAHSYYIITYPNLFRKLSTQINGVWLVLLLIDIILHWPVYIFIIRYFVGKHSLHYLKHIIVWMPIRKSQKKVYT